MTDSTNKPAPANAEIEVQEPYQECVVRLQRFAENDPEGFARLVGGETEGVDERLVDDMQRVRSRLFD